MLTCTSYDVEKEKAKEMLGDIVTECPTERRPSRYLRVTASSNTDLPPYLYQGSMFRSIAEMCGQAFMPFHACMYNIFLSDALLMNFRRSF